MFVSSSLYEIAISFLASLWLALEKLLNFLLSFRVLTLLVYACLPRAVYPQMVLIHSKDLFVLW